MEAMVEAIVDVGVISDGGRRRPPVVGAAGGLEAGDTEEPERSGDDEAAGLAVMRTMAAEEGGELLGGEEEEVSLNWERSVGPLDGAAGKLSIVVAGLLMTLQTWWLYTYSSKE